MLFFLTTLISCTAFQTIRSNPDVEPVLRKIEVNRNTAEKDKCTMYMTVELGSTGTFSFKLNNGQTTSTIKKEFVKRGTGDLFVGSFTLGEGQELPFTTKYTVEEVNLTVDGNVINVKMSDTISFATPDIAVVVNCVASLGSKRKTHIITCTMENLKTDRAYTFYYSSPQVEGLPDVKATSKPISETKIASEVEIADGSNNTFKKTFSYCIDRIDQDGHELMSPVLPSFTASAKSVACALSSLLVCLIALF
ncbi:hypothetical protein BLNAU_7989 [Blattamonas nauphoetae]|uniref:Uncharacterized protein n=1 Tax=Blattamonas nauphoetae TaxID=2049346 RepID=A0ABQ9Y0E6_9EUKA|nr:hypothetical protein BLNAU_7989 [Blattamonas nauphoetae]